MKLLTATEWAGVVFALSLIVHTAQGFELFNKLFQHQGNIHDNNREDNLENNRHQDNGEEDDDSKSGNDCDNDNINENIPDDDGT